MPTVTAVALDTLLLGRPSVDTASRPGNRSSTPAEPQPRPRAVEGDTGAPRRGIREEENRLAASSRPMTTSSSSPAMSPALYATPKAFRVSGDSTPSDSLSPYVVDHKGRARAPSPLASSTTTAADENGCKAIEDAKRVEVVDKLVGGGEEPPPRATEPSGLDVEGGRSGTEDAATAAAAGADNDDSGDEEFDDDFFDSRASLRSASFSDAESSGGVRRTTFGRRDPGNASFASTNEYYDAGTNFSLDSPAAGGRLSLLLDEKESELRSMRLALFDELEKRAKAEESLAKLRDRWNRMASGLSKLGLSSFPPVPSNSYQAGGEDAARCEQEEEEDPVDVVGKEIVVTRLVLEAIARGVGQAEAEESVQVAVEAKNREIARLRERLNYYEAVNHEMSQRNLEIAEQARRRRQKRKMIRRIMWGSIGFVVVTGASLLAYTYLPQPSNSSSPLPAEDMEPSSSS